MRFTATYVASAKWAYLRGYLLFASGFALAVSALVGLGTDGVVYAVFRGSEGTLLSTFLIGTIAIPFYAILQIWSGCVRGLKHVILSQIPVSIVQQGSFLLLLLLWRTLPIANGNRADAVMLINVASAVIAATLCGSMLLRFLPRFFWSAQASFLVRPWLSVGASLMLINGCNVLLQRAPLLLLGTLAGSEQAGLYAPASRIALTISFGLTAVNSWAAPMIADLYARGDHMGLQRLIRLATRTSVIFTLPITLAVALWGRNILALFGAQYVAAYPALVILSCGQFINALWGPVGFLLTMTGRETVAARVLMLNTAMCILAGMFLTSQWGVLGAAVASSIVTAFGSLPMVFIVWRRMRIRATFL